MTLKFFFYSLSLFSYLSVAQAEPISTQSLNDFNKDFESLCEAQQFSGAILIAKQDAIIYEKACGFANRNFNVTNTLDTKFNVGSVSKLFTSVAIAQLVEKEKLNLNTSLVKIIPSWLPEDIAKKITVAELLIHTSGMGNYIEESNQDFPENNAACPTWLSNRNAYTQLDDYKNLMQDSTLLFKPGSNQYYSNNGYILLGAIIEKLSQQSYNTYLKKFIFKPAAMNDTDFYKLDEPTHNRAEGYMYQCNNGKCVWKNNFLQTSYFGNSAGGAYSTVGDLFKFARALHQHVLLTPQLTDEVLSQQKKAPRKDLDVYLAIKPMKIKTLEIPVNFSKFGFAGAWNQYGFAAWDNPSFLGQTGGTQGASAFFGTSPDGEYTIIILSNVSGSGTLLLYKRIRSLLGFNSEIMNF